MPSFWKVLTLCPQFPTSILQLPCSEEEKKKSQMTDNAIHRISMAPMTMSRNLFQCTQTWGQTHHRLGISQALEQLPASSSGRTRGEEQVIELIMAKKKGLQHFFHLQNNLLKDLIAQEEILPSLHSHWRSLLLGKEKQRKQLQERQMCMVTFFSGAAVCR